MSDQKSIDVDATFRDVAQAMECVPFGQSAFQNVQLADDATTPGRRMRYVLLQLHQKLHALKASDFRRRRLEIDLREAKLVAARSTGFDLERLNVTIEEKQWSLDAEMKLIRDMELEVRTFLAMFESLPKVVSREQFEQEELEHYRGKFVEQARAELLTSGTMASDTVLALQKVGIDPRQIAALPADPFTTTNLSVDVNVEHVGHDRRLGDRGHSDGAPADLKGGITCQSL